MPENARLVVYCLLKPANAAALEDVRAHYAEVDPRVEVIVDRRIGQRRRALTEVNRPERRGGTDRRRFIVARRLKPLPEELAERAGEVRWTQRMLPVSAATEAMGTDEVLEAVRRGNPEAPTELYWRSYERMRSRLVVLLGADAAADRAVVHAFGRVLDALDDPARELEPFDQLLYEQVDAAAEEALKHRDGDGEQAADGGLAVLDPALDEPVEIVDPDPHWAAEARGERDRILGLISDHLVALEHVGGTAVPTLPGRRTIDLMAGVHRMPLGPEAIEALEEVGYEHCGDGGTPGRIYLRRRGDNPVDLHIVVYGGALWQDTLLLRDHLRRHPVEAQRWATVRSDAARRAPTSALRYYDLRRLTLEELLERARRDAAAPRAAA